MRCHNPFAFSPVSVTLATVFIYLGVFTSLIIIHETVPPAPANPTAYRGLNLTEAWLDLAELSSGYHPFNSRRNDVVRDWLLRRIDDILRVNGVEYGVEGGEFGIQSPGNVVHKTSTVHASIPAVVVFNDIISNYTSTALTSIGISGRRAGISTYFEGNNIIVYIRGNEDEEDDWWSPPSFRSSKIHGKGGVLVSAHIDSVSTGYGATDDGVGVVTILQLIRYFTAPGNTPNRGIVALLNNGEEDGLYGARAFLSHPMASFVHTFLNLEGAGAGGRATLFRSTDTEVTRAYAQSKHPFGSVVSSDGFSLGIVRSETDYVVFRGEGYRGLDVAFYEPRSRYHTDQDDAKHTSRDSLWHMLSSSVETVKYLASETDEFVGPRGDNSRDKVRNGRGSDGVWFDLFGRVFAVFGLRTLFAWSLALLISSPLILTLVTYLLVRQEKYYLFSSTVKPEEEGEPVSLYGWRGFFRFPFAFVFASALTVGAAFLVRKFNPLVIYSSPYAVWAMSLSLFVCAYWFVMAGANFVRPSALHRIYVLIWMFALGWVVLIAATVFEDRFHISTGYLFVLYESAIFLATLIGLLEMFALARKTSIVDAAHDIHDTQAAIEAVPHSDALVAAASGQEDEATETSPLIGGNSPSLGATFNRYRRAAADEVVDGHEKDSHTYGDEQAWSAKLPTWAWLIQFLLIGPFTLVVLGQVGLLLVTALSQTGSDGGSLLLPYLVVSLFSILLITPLAPFIHRITHHIPTFFFLIFTGTLIYNLSAFPFSPANRYKAYFQQTVDLDTSLSHVTLAGLETFIRPIIAAIPSASGQSISCSSNPSTRAGLSFCTYIGPPPNILLSYPAPPEKSYHDWLHFNVTRTPHANLATFHIRGRGTRACAIHFVDPISSFHVRSAAPLTDRSPDVPESGSDLVKLWSRDWNHTWVVDVEWAVSEGKVPGEEGREGKVSCSWSEWDGNGQGKGNGKGQIPALEEVWRNLPVWATVTKLAEGLVLGERGFVV